MNLVKISFKSIWARPLSTFLSWLLLTFGVSVVVLILLTSSQLKNEVAKHSRGIDLVVGAKGSPLQLILSCIFHIDFPTGNIALSDAAELANSRYIAEAVPLSLGDSYAGFRIVGTTPAYAQMYQGELVQGSWYKAPLEVVLGAEVAIDRGLQLGDTFESQHGLSEDGSGHEGEPFVVKGVLGATNTVIDRLILTNTSSIWQVHAHDEAHEAHSDSLITLSKLGLEVTPDELANQQITALLIHYRSPMGAVMLPRQVNATSNLQSASPAYETARLFNVLGVGISILEGLGVLIIVISAISVFIALLNSLKDRKYEIAIMRSMGATKSQIFKMILLEGFAITVLGVISGLLLAHGLIVILAANLEGFQLLSFYFADEEWWVLAGCLLLGMLAALLPSWLAYRTDISKTLSKR